MPERMMAEPAIAAALAAIAALVRGEARRAGEDEHVAPFTDWAGASLVALAVLSASHGLRGVALAATCGALTVGAACDARSGYLFDVATLPPLIAAIVLAGASSTLPAAIAGALALGVPFALVAACTRGDALGFGDVKAYFAIGATFGTVEGALVIAAACWTGLFEAAVRRRRIVRFGPHLAAGAVVVALAGHDVLRSLGGA